jgi:ribosomal protein S18 acetylase RimI-like enzyme
VRLRPAVAADAPGLRALVESAYAVYVPRIGLRPAPMDADYDDLVARGLVTVAEAGGDLAGTLVLVPAADHLLIENVAVDPTHQGEGIGAALMRLAEERARAGGIGEIRLYTHRLMTENRAWYARLGYEETSRETQDGFDRIFFSKRL